MTFVERGKGYTVEQYLQRVRELILSGEWEWNSGRNPWYHGLAGALLKTQTRPVLPYTDKEWAEYRYSSDRLVVEERDRKGKVHEYAVEPKTWYIAFDLLVEVGCPSPICCFRGTQDEALSLIDCALALHYAKLKG